MMKYLIALALSVVPALSIAMDFTWQNMALLYGKLYPRFDYQESVEDYIKEFYPKKWALLKNDEFQLQEKKPSYIAEMKQKVAAYSVDETYTIRTAVSIGSYDFKNGIFPIEKGLQANTYFYTDPDNTASYQLTSYPRQFKLFFSNGEGVRLEMDQDKAKAFIASRKDKYGNVDRRVTLILTAKVTGFREASSSDEFISDIVSYRFEF